MTEPRFLQIHSLHSYPAALLNRDDSGLAKRMPFGGATRARISSQCLKRHWRVADGEFALNGIDGFTDTKRTRNAIPEFIMKDLPKTDIANAVATVFQEKIYSNSGVQPLLLGLPELEYFRSKATAICTEYPEDADAAKRAAEDIFHTRRGEGNNWRAMRAATQLPGGLISALFGRMVTSDTTANIDAAIHVAHAFTVHREENHLDYWAAIEDLATEEQGPGAAHLNDMELTAGLFYGYVVVDVPGLVSNLSGCDADEWQDEDRELAAKVVQHLIHLIAKVSPGAKLGSTAPYAAADMMLIEAGSRQPRSLANAYRKPAQAQVDDAVSKLSDYLGKLDRCYGNGEARRMMSVEDYDLPGAEWLDCDALANWAADAIRNGEV